MLDLTSLTLSLQELLQNGKHSEGLALYQALNDPSAHDDRYGGMCLWALGRYEEAKIPLYKAVQRGEGNASLDLIQIHLQLNEFSEASDWIEIASKLELTTRNRVEVLLCEGDFHAKLGRNRLAIKSLKSAWVQANILESTETIARVAQSLAAALQNTGQDYQALKYLNKALLRVNGSWETILKITQAYSEINVGNLSIAQSILLATQRSSESNQNINSYFLIANGFFSVAQLKLEDAARQFELAIQSSEKVDNKEFQLLARAWAAASYLSIHNLDKARAVLMPLSNLELAPVEEAVRQFRVGQLQTATHDLESARISLESAVATFATLEHQRELAWALLRLAHLHLERGDTKLSNQTLERVSDIANSIGGTAFLVPELNLIGLETVKRLAEIATPYAMHALIPVLEPDRTVTIPLESRPLVRRLRVITLGKPMLLAEDRNVTPRLNKAMELIAYLVLHPQSSLERILDSVFPDSDPKAAANYFHQIRHKLTRDVPELRVVQDKQTKTYALDSGTVPLESDYEDVVKLLNHATQNELHQALEIYRGAFMPHLETAWVEEVRNNVEWLLVRSGLRVVQDLYDRGSFEDCRKLTEKLRKVAPLDEGLNELLVRATNEIDGLLAARRTLSDVEKYFHAEVGELPPSLENLKQEIKLNLN